MAYTDRATLLTSSTDFLGRVRAAALDYCLAVQAEGAITDHDIRQSFADLVFADATGAWTTQLAWLASEDGTNDSSTDETLIARVASLWSQAASLAVKESL
jgi:hypothetical protein